MQGQQVVPQRQIRVELCVRQRVQQKRRELRYAFLTRRARLLVKLPDRLFVHELLYSMRMKLAYENDASKPLGASYMPTNVVRLVQTGSNIGPSLKDVPALQENRGNLLNRSSQDQTRVAHFLGQLHALEKFGFVSRKPETPATNEYSLAGASDWGFPKVVADKSTGYATSGAQYGADVRK